MNGILVYEFDDGTKVWRLPPDANGPSDACLFAFRRLDECVRVVYLAKRPDGWSCIGLDLGSADDMGVGPHVRSFFRGEFGFDGFSEPSGFPDQQICGAPLRMGTKIQLGLGDMGRPLDPMSDDEVEKVMLSAEILDEILVEEGKNPSGRTRDEHVTWHQVFNRIFPFNASPVKVEDDGFDQWSFHVRGLSRGIRLVHLRSPADSDAFDRHPKVWAKLLPGERESLVGRSFFLFDSQMRLFASGSSWEEMWSEASRVLVQPEREMEWLDSIILPGHFTLSGLEVFRMLGEDQPAFWKFDRLSSYVEANRS